MPLPEGPGPLPAWNYNGGPGRGEALLRYIDERLLALDYYLQRVARAINQGPLAGGYFPITLRVYDDGAALGVGDEGIPLPLNFNTSPHYLSAGARGGRVTLQLVDDDDYYLVTALDTGSATPWVNVRSGFTMHSSPKPASLRLRIESVVSGSPVEVEALLVCAHVQKVDDPQV